MSIHHETHTTPASKTPPKTTSRSISDHLTSLEARTRLIGGDLYGEALDCAMAAEYQGDDSDRMRAQLLLADLLMRRGHVVTGSQRALEIKQWAQTSGDDYIIARCARVLSGYHYRLGDTAEAFSTAITCTSLLPATAPLVIKLDHRLCVADGLATSGSYAQSHQEYEHCIDLAKQLGDNEWRLVTLNNYAVTMHEQKDYKSAETVIHEMMSIWNESLLCTDYCYLETLARLRMGMGQLDAATDFLEPVATATHVPASVDPYGFADCLYAYVELMLLRSDTELARYAIDRLQTLDAEHGGLLSPSALLVLEASVYAAEAHYHKAYECQKKAYEKLEREKNDERDAKSRLLHAIHGAEEAQESSNTFRRLSYTDPLTSIGNRRYVSEKLPRLLSGASEQPVAIIALDIDHFKRINDHHSHAIGDAVLQDVAAFCANVAGCSVTRNSSGNENRWSLDVMATFDQPHSLAARLGGEEFLLAVPVTNSDEAEYIALELLNTIRDHDWPDCDGIKGVTVSAGLVVVTESHDSMAVLDEADSRLYAAKAAGRDQLINHHVDDS